MSECEKASMETSTSLPEPRKAPETPETSPSLPEPPADGLEDWDGVYTVVCAVYVCVYVVNVCVCMQATWGPTTLAGSTWCRC